MKYIVVIGDIVSSRKVAQRARLQSDLKRVLDAINRENNRFVVSPYTITLGDEFQAVFSGTDALFRHTAEILKALHPVKARFSFGIGTIETPINRKQAIGMDGEAFHRARQALERLKKHRTLYAVEGLAGTVGGLTAQSLDLVSHFSRNWRRSRQQVFAMLARQLPVKAIAKAAGMTDQAVYKTIDAGALRTILSIFHQVEIAMKEELGRK